MAEIWGAAIAVGGAAISAYASNKQAEKTATTAASTATAATANEAKYSAILSQFNAEQDYYYNQLEKQNKERGLSEFRKFSSLSSYAPEYQQTTTGVVVPEKSTIQDIEAQNTASTSSSSSGSSGSSTWSKIDPLGSSIAKKISKLF